MLYAKKSLMSLEGIVVCECELGGVEEESLVRCVIDGVERDEKGEWRIRSIQLVAMASMAKTLPDTLSKIVFQEMARLEPLSLERIVEAL